MSIYRRFNVSLTVRDASGEVFDGRAKDAARYPPALCRAICRGILKEKMERQMGLRAMVEVGEGVHRRNVDTEEHHDDEERSIRAQLEKLEEEIASYCSDVASSGTASGPHLVPSRSACGDPANIHVTKSARSSRTFSSVISSTLGEI